MAYDNQNGLYDQNPQYNLDGSYSQNPQYNPNGLYSQNPQSNLNMPSAQPANATAAFVLSIIGLVAWLIPLFGFPVNIVGLVLSVIGVRENRKHAKAARVMSIVGLSLTGINSLIGAINGALYYY